LANIEDSIKDAKYAVRGEVIERLGQVEKEMKEDPSKYPFTQSVALNIGNPHVFKPPLLKFNREVVAATNCPSLLESGVFSDDVQR
jgi:alanine transaminase